MIGVSRLTSGFFHSAISAILNHRDSTSGAERWQQMILRMADLRYTQMS
jgi:hypothetical protein